MTTWTTFSQYSPAVFDSGGMSNFNHSSHIPHANAPSFTVGSFNCVNSPFSLPLTCSDTSSDSSPSVFSLPGELVFLTRSVIVSIKDFIVLFSAVNLSFSLSDSPHTLASNSLFLSVNCLVTLMNSSFSFFRFLSISFFQVSTSSLTC